MGFLVGIANALFSSFGNTQLRKLSGVNTYLVNLFRFSAAAIVTAILVSVFSLWRVPSLPFWLIVAVSVPIELAIALCYVRAFQLSPQSLVGPLFSFSAIFLIPLAYFFVGELPSKLGALGILSALVGALFLGWDFSNPGVGKAVTRIFEEHGSYYMLGAAAGGGLAVAIAKYAYQYAPPLLFAFYVTLGLVVIHTPVLFWKSFRDFDGRWREAGLIAGAFGIGQALHYTGISLLLAAYYISIKRLSIVFDVLLGRTLGREDHFRERLIGALFMVAGVILIALS